MIKLFIQWNHLTDYMIMSYNYFVVPDTSKRSQTNIHEEIDTEEKTYRNVKWGAMSKDLKNTRDYVLTKHIPDLFEVRSLLINIMSLIVKTRYCKYVFLELGGVLQDFKILTITFKQASHINAKCQSNHLYLPIFYL